MSWSALEQKIVERLKDKLGAAVKSVYTTAQYAETEERSQTTPNVGVIYQGYAPVSAAGGLSATYAGRTQMIQKTFYVVVAVRNALNTSTSEGARNQSAPIVEAVIRFLVGWRPADLREEGPLQLEPAPGPAFTDAGFAYYPIAFSNRRTYVGDTT